MTMESGLDASARLLLENYAAVMDAEDRAYVYLEEMWNLVQERLTTPHPAEPSPTQWQPSKVEDDGATRRSSRHVKTKAVRDKARAYGSRVQVAALTVNAWDLRDRRRFDGKDSVQVHVAVHAGSKDNLKSLAGDKAGWNAKVEEERAGLCLTGARHDWATASDGSEYILKSWLALGLRDKHADAQLVADAIAAAGRAALALQRI